MKCFSTLSSRFIAAILSVCVVLLCVGCGSTESGINVPSGNPVPDNTKEATGEGVKLPVLEDFSVQEWDGSGEPVPEKGSWSRSYAVMNALREQASAYADVKPQHTFSLAHHGPENSAPGELMVAWVYAVTVATKGRVKINAGFSETLSGALSSMDDLEQGILDFNWTLPCYFKGYMPLTNVVQNPGLGIRDGAVGSRVAWELFKESPDLQEEIRAHGEPLFLCVNCTSPLSYKGSTPVQDIGMIKGNIRANDGPARLFVEEVGATVYGCPIVEVYNNVSHRIIDYLITDWNGIDSFALSDPGVLDYYLDANLGCSAFVLQCNKDVWDSLEPEYQDALRSVSGDYMLNFVDMWNYWEALGRFHAVENGGTIYSPSEEFAYELEAIYETVSERWIMQQSNPDNARWLYERAKELAAQYDTENQS